MGQESKSAQFVAFGLILVLLAAIGGAAYKFILYPIFLEKKEKAQKVERLQGDAVKLGAEPFAGYAIFRSSVFRDDLARQGIPFAVQDIPNYSERMKALEDGIIHIAAFTIDADLIIGGKMKGYPGVIALVIDESKGADGIVAYKAAVPNVQALNRSDAKIVTTTDAPSETLARHMISGLLPAITGDSWVVEANGADDVLRQMRRADKSAIRAYALYEPQLSKALEIEGVHLIYDSSKVSSTIVDVLLINQDYLKADPAKARKVVETYLRTLNHYQSQGDNGMSNLLLEDSKLTGDILSEGQARSMASKIKWANTMENYAHFGLLSTTETRGLTRIDTMIAQIARLLVKTGKLANYKMAGREHELYSDITLRAMQADGFYPGTVGTKEGIRGTFELPALTDDQWTKLIVVGNMDAKTIDFVRSRSELSVQGKRDVSDIVAQLQAWSNYYLRVVGNARASDDQSAATRLAGERAKTVADRIVQLGINSVRVKATAAAPSQDSYTGQNVTFTLLQNPY